MQLSELDRAESLADRLLTAVGVREQGKSALGAAAETRQRAFTLFVNAYDEVRRAVAYLRFHQGDLEKIAPSLYSGRKQPRPEGEVAAEVPVAPGTPPAVTPPATPPAVPPTPGAGSNGGAATAPGMPGADPFARR